MNIFNEFRSLIFGNSNEALLEDTPAPSDAGKIDVAADLESRTAEHPENLDWKKSIVDLMKLVGMDSSYDNRKAMAIELGYSEADIEKNGSAEMNLWLHKKVLAQFAEESAPSEFDWAGISSFGDANGMA